MTMTNRKLNQCGRRVLLALEVYAPVSCPFSLTLIFISFANTQNFRAKFKHRTCFSLAIFFGDARMISSKVCGGTPYDVQRRAQQLGSHNS